MATEDIQIEKETKLSIPKINKTSEEYDVNINKQKSNVVIIIKIPEDNLNINMDGCQLERIEQLKYLANSFPTIRNFALSFGISYVESFND